MEKIYRVVIVADFRSPHALGWVNALYTSGNFEIHAVSSHFCKSPECVASFNVIGLDFSRLKWVLKQVPLLKPIVLKLTSKINISNSPKLRYGKIFSQIDRASLKLRRLIENIKPDVVHALRIPFEGILTSASMPQDIPFVMSVWGNDFTLFGQNPAIGLRISQALRRANSLHVDASRDRELAIKFGFDVNKSVVVFPANGGVDLQQKLTTEDVQRLYANLRIPNSVRDIIINPRGISPYIQTENFLRAIPICLTVKPNLMFIALATKQAPHIQQLVKLLGIEAHIRLTDYVTPEVLRSYLKLSKIMVSPTDHDGTPITLLESMACGCLPVASDLPSIREWLQDGSNGLLIDPQSPESIASAILEGLNNSALRNNAQQINQKLIRERASKVVIRDKMVGIYNNVMNQYK